ncbi:hypothetical protein PRJ_5518 (plasmid) [Pseudomonas sp. XWY-1]|nr:hypothetical protein PRJ_5518 [Pseudomonas sp. XWY-1]
MPFINHELWPLSPRDLYTKLREGTVDFLFSSNEFFVGRFTRHEGVPVVPPAQN